MGATFSAGLWWGLVITGLSSGGEAGVYGKGLTPPAFSKVENKQVTRQK